MPSQPVDLLLLDLDRTLVHSLPDSTAECGVLQGAFDHFRVRMDDGSHSRVHVRPYAAFLLSRLEQHRRKGKIRYGVWTAGTPSYARQVVDGLLRLAGVRRCALAAVLTRKDATLFPNGSYVKCLAPLAARFGARRVWLADVVLNPPCRLPFLPTQRMLRSKRI